MRLWGVIRRINGICRGALLSGCLGHMDVPVSFLLYFSVPRLISFKSFLRTSRPLSPGGRSTFLLVQQSTQKRTPRRLALRVPSLQPIFEGRIDRPSVAWRYLRTRPCVLTHKNRPALGSFAGAPWGAGFGFNGWKADKNTHLVVCCWKIRHFVQSLVRLANLLKFIDKRC